MINSSLAQWDAISSTSFHPRLALAQLCGLIMISAASLCAALATSEQLQIWSCAAPVVGLSDDTRCCIPSEVSKLTQLRVLVRRNVKLAECAPSKRPPLKRTRIRQPKDAGDSTPRSACTVIHSSALSCPSGQVGNMFIQRPLAAVRAWNCGRCTSSSRCACCAASCDPS